MLKDKDIREPLFDFLEEQYGKTRIIEEKTMGKSRADVVMVLEEELVGIEIKSDADTYARLSRQVKDYDRFLIGIMSLPVRGMLITWGNMYLSGGALLPWRK